MGLKKSKCCKCVSNCCEIISHSVQPEGSKFGTDDKMVRLSRDSFLWPNTYVKHDLFRGS